MTLLLCTYYVSAGPYYCDSTSIDETARNACEDLMSKRSISELNQLGYVLEDVKGKTVSINIRSYAFKIFIA